MTLLLYFQSKFVPVYKVEQLLIFTIFVTVKKIRKQKAQILLHKLKGASNNGDALNQRTDETYHWEQQKLNKNFRPYS